MEKAFLIWEEISKDEDGYPVTIEHRTEVYAREKSVTRSEHYEAQRAGVTIRTILEIRIEDYNLSKHIEEDKKLFARKIEFDGEVFEIERAYKTDMAMIQLSCK